MGTSVEANLLLESYLKQLRLPGFLGNYRKFAEDAAQTNLSFDRYLLSLAEQEIAQRERNRQVRLIKAARFPVLKELADFDFSCVPSVNKQQVLELAQGGYIRQAEPILLVGNPGLGKTHRGDRLGRRRLSPGLSGALLQCGRVGQRSVAGRGRAPGSQTAQRGAQAEPDRAG